MAGKQRKAAVPSYLKQRRLGWYVQLPVPRAAQAALGAKVLTRSLRTRDAVEARQRRHAVIAELQETIARALTHPDNAAAPPSAATLVATAEALRAAQDAGQATEADTEGAFAAALETHLEAQARRRGRDDDGHPLLPASEVATVRRASAIAAGRTPRTLSALADSYLRELATGDGARRTSTVDDKRRHLDAFMAWFGSDREASEVSPEVAGDYLSEVIQRRTRRAPGAPEGAPQVPTSLSTRQKELSAVASFFTHLALRRVIAFNPFAGMAATLRPSKRGTGPKRRPWTATELSTVLHGVPTSDPAWSLVALAAYSGMRREEIALLRIESIDRDSFQVLEGKTDASLRRVPIHPVIAPLVQQLAASTSDGFLLPGLLPGGPDHKRGWLVGKRLSGMLRSLGITDARVTLHSLRNTVITQLGAAGVDLSIRQLIVGHAPQGVTLRNYTGPLPDDPLRVALARVSYGAELDAYVSETGPLVVIAKKAKPRKRV